MGKEKVINVQELNAGFEDHVVLKDVSFSAYKGEVTVVLGGSGSGKTTLFRHLLGLLPIHKGRVSVLGREVADLDEEDQLDLYLQMGVFYQTGALLSSLTVAENVGLPLVQHTRMPQPLIDEIVRMKLGLVNLSHAYHQYPAELSGGMIKRAALARAIAMDPPLLFCDEPGAGLDPVLLESLDRLLLNLKEQLGISILLVTHEVTSILRVADRVVFLDEGVVAFEGPLKEALHADHPSVRAFFSVLKTEHLKEILD
ncbi:MAG: ABC transporter ATP-binding protein [Bacteroidales bacterium]